MSTVNYSINDFSTYAADLAAIEVDESYTQWTNIDDDTATVGLTNSVTFNGVAYSTIYISSNGAFTFNDVSPFNLASIIGFQLPVADLLTISPKCIYYKEDVINKTFTLLYNTAYYEDLTITYQVEAILYLDENAEAGNVTINFGNMHDLGGVMSCTLGCSFGTGAGEVLVDTNFLEAGSTTIPASPYQEIPGMQSTYSGKQLNFTFTYVADSNITNRAELLTFLNDPNPTSNIGLLDNDIEIDVGDDLIAVSEKMITNPSGDTMVNIVKTWLG